MKMKATSTWKRHQFCGGASVFGTQCYIDEITEFVHCSCNKQDLKGLDWTIVFYLFKIVSNEKTHLVDRYNIDKNNRSQEQVWQDLANRFNIHMNFVTEDDVMNGVQLKNFLLLTCGKLHIRILL